MAAATVKGNTDRIETWKGQFELKRYSLANDPWVDVSDHAVEPSGDAVVAAAGSGRLRRQQFPGTYIRRSRFKGGFVVDLPGDRLFSTRELVGSWDYERVDGEHQFRVPVERHTSLQQDSILTAREFIHVGQNYRYSKMRDLPEAPEPPGGFQLVYTEPSKSGRDSTRTLNVFDPRRLLESGGRTHHFQLETIFNWVENSELDVLVSRMDESTYQIQYQYTSGERSTKTLSAIDGHLMMTESLLEHPRRGTSHNRWEYTSIDGVMVPVVYSYEHRSVDGQIDRRRVARLTDVRINEPVTDADFDVARFGVAPLTRLKDEINQEVGIFISSTDVVSAGDFTTDMLDPEVEYVEVTPAMPLAASRTSLTAEVTSGSQYTFRQFLVVVNVVLIGIVAGMIVRRRLRGVSDT